MMETLQESMSDFMKQQQENDKLFLEQLRKLEVPI